MISSPSFFFIFVLFKDKIFEFKKKNDKRYKKVVGLEQVEVLCNVIMLIGFEFLPFLFGIWGKV